MKKAHVLFVCLGNICRSPTAHGIFREMVRQENLSQIIHVDSAGTSGWHIDEPPDKRTCAAAKNRGFDLSDLRGREFIRDDFSNFDYILAMDKNNLAEIKRLQPSDYGGHVGLFLEFSGQSHYLEVPDPYYGGSHGFQTVFDLVKQGCAGLLDHIKVSHL